MKRYAIRLVLFLLLGAIVNVAVAWGFMVLVHVGAEPVEYQFARESVVGATAAMVTIVEVFSWRGATYIAIRPNRWDGIGAITKQSQRIIPAWAGAYRAQYERERPEGDLLEIVAAGFPSRSMHWTYRRHIQTTPCGAWLLNHPSIDLTLALPLRPLWSGFAINTIFFAAVLWLVWITPGFVRRRIRRFRGQCLHCGYDLRGQPPDSNKCPECGRDGNAETQRRRNAETMA